MKMRQEFNFRHRYRIAMMMKRTKIHIRITNNKARCKMLFLIWWTTLSKALTRIQAQYTYIMVSIRDKMDNRDQHYSFLPSTRSNYSNKAKMQTHRRNTWQHSNIRADSHHRSCRQEDRVQVTLCLRFKYYSNRSLCTPSLNRIVRWTEISTITWPANLNDENRTIINHRYLNLTINSSKRLTRLMMRIPSRKSTSRNSRKRVLNSREISRADWAT